MSAVRIAKVQLLELAGISHDTLRYWKDALPPIRGRDGRRQGYSFAEAVAIAAIAAAVEEFGIEVSRFSADADEYFGRVKAMLGSGGPGMWLGFSAGQWFSDAELDRAGDVVLYFRIGRIAEHLRERLTGTEAYQLSLL